MDAARWQQVKRILAEALECEDAAARAAVIEKECAADDALRAEVDAFLAQQADHLDNFADGRDAPRRSVGRRIGAYELVRELGRGGMGAVWLAQRADARFEQQVAVKLLKRGTDTEEVLRRFQAERRILARLEHPGIARLFDAGETDDGLPFFVMEYVAGGETLTAFARKHALSITERLELFRKVCLAVQFAHQNLVVHRDLKPGNILITQDGEPKLLDFGIAKLLEPGFETWEVTAPGHERLTPGFASPEQIRGQPVTTVSDVYALGALLYEMLCGTPPHHRSGLPPSRSELLRTVCEEEPVRPSVAATAPEIRRQLRGDLDTIVLRAMSKAPERRYPSAVNFGDDLRRYLEGRPVRARPDTLGYRARKFVARNRTGTIAAALAITILLVSVVVTTREARIAERERARSERRFRELRRVANSFLFEVDDAIATHPTAARKILVQRAREYLDSLAAEASGDASLQSELAAAYEKLGDVGSQLNKANIGDTAGALESYRKALDLREVLFAQAPPGSENGALRLALAESYRRLGDILTKTGNTAAALVNYRKTLPLLEPLEPASMTRPTRIALASNYEIIGRTLYRSGDFPGAVAHYEKALAVTAPLTREVSGDPAAQLERTKTLSSLGYLLAEAGRKDEALQYYRENLAITERVLAADPQNQTLQRRLMEAHEWVATGLRDCGDLAAALVEYDQAQKLCENALRADTANVQTRNDLADIFHNIGLTHYRQGDGPGALRDAQTAKQYYDSVAATDPLNVHAQRQVVAAEQEIGEALALSGDRPAASIKLRESLAGFQKLAAQDGANTEFQLDEARGESALGTSLAQCGETREAAEHLRRAVPLFEALAALSPMSANVRDDLDRARKALAEVR